MPVTTTRRCIRSREMHHRAFAADLPQRGNALETRNEGTAAGDRRSTEIGRGERKELARGVSRRRAANANRVISAPACSRRPN